MGAAFFNTHQKTSREDTACDHKWENIIKVDLKIHDVRIRTEFILKYNIP